MQHVANNVMIGVRNLHEKGDEMERKRGFEIVSAYEGKGISVPKRSTKHSAGYDFEAAEDIVLPSICKRAKSAKTSACANRNQVLYARR